MNKKDKFLEFLHGKSIVQAILVGLLSGLTVVLFKICINSLFSFVQNSVSNLSLYQKIIYLPAITTLGGLISGILIQKFAPETKGSGIPFVKMVMARMGNITRARSIIIKFLAGVAGIGTGMSLGREGPSVQLGAGCGAFIGKIFKLKGAMQEKLIASGAGSAIGATFNAPIAGTLFVFEELTNKFNPKLLFTVLIATVTASGVARHILGNNPSFVMPEITSTTSIESLFVCAVLGVIAGILGALFAKIIYFNNAFFDKLTNVPFCLKPAMAGFTVGIVGLFIPYALGSGNLAVDALLAHKFSLLYILAIFVVKFFITPFCFGSGAAGGIFLPMLMLGAFLGYIVASISNLLGLNVDPIIISMIGMGAFLSAVARTPITAAVMVFEMTSGYKFILPIMLSAAIADLVAQKLNHKPIYSKLIVNSLEHSELNIPNYVNACDCMTKEVVKFTSNTTLEKIIEKTNKLPYNFYPIVDNKNHLLGLISKSDIEDAILQKINPKEEISLIMDTEPVIINKTENLCIAYYRLHINNANILLVVDDDKKLAGVVTRKDINKKM